MAFPSNIAGIFSGAGGGEIAGNSLIRMGVDYSGLKGQARAAVNDFTSGMRDGARGVQEQSRVWSTAFAGLRIAAIGAFTGAAAAAGIGATAAINYESAFAGVIKTVDAAPEVIDHLRSRFRELATEIPISATEFARLGEAAGALGVAAEDIEEFARVTALIGVTTDVSSDQAATALGQLGNVLKLTSDDYERFGSTLVDLGNKGASTESQILEIASRAGAAGRLIGLSTPEILAFSSAVANLGIETEAGGSALQFLFTSLTLLMQDEDKLRTLGETAGMTGEQFRTAFKEDALGAILAFFDGLGQLDAEGQTAILDELGLAGIRTSRAYLGIAASLDDNLLPALGTANQAWDENNALQIEADKRFETTASQITLLKNRVGDLFIELGNNLLPAIRDGVSWLADNIPGIASRIADVWNETFGPAVSRMLEGFLDLAGAIFDLFSGMFDIFSGGGDQTLDFWDHLGGLLAVVADFLGKIASSAASILNNEVVQTLLQFAAGWALVRLAFDGIQRSSRWLTQLGPKTLQFLSFGAIPAGGTPPPTVGQQAAATAAGAAAGEGIGGADELQVAARDLKAAAAALKASASALTGAAAASGILPDVPLPGAQGPRLLPTTAPAAPLLLPGPAAEQATVAGQRIWEESAYAVNKAAADRGRGPGALVGQAARDAGGAGRALLSALGTAIASPFRLIARSGRAALSSGPAQLFAQAGRDAADAGKSLISAIGSTLASGASSGLSALRSGGAAALRLGAGVLNAASRAFWPAMALLFAVDIVKAPIGQFVSDVLGKSNLGAEIQRDFFSGVGTWLTSIVEGVDVEKIANLEANEFTFGGVTITRAEAAKAGLTRVTMEKLFGGEMTLEDVVIGQAEVEKILGAGVPEIDTDVLPGTDAFRAQGQELLDRAKELGVDVVTLYQEEFGAGWLRAMSTSPSPEMQDRIRAAIEQALAARRADFERDWDTLVREPVEQALKDEFGATEGQLAFLTDSDIESLAVMLSRNIDGSLTPEIEALLQRVADKLNDHTYTFEPPDIENPELRFATGETITGEGPGGTRKTVVAPQGTRLDIDALQKMIDDQIDWQDLLHSDAAEQAMVDEANRMLRQYGKAITAAAENPDLREGLVQELGFNTWEEVVAANERWLSTTGNQRALDMATLYADIIKTTSSLGIDLSEEQWAKNMRTLLLNLIDADALTPEIAEQITDLLNGAEEEATDAILPAVIERGKKHGRDLGGAVGAGLRGSKPEIIDAYDESSRAPDDPSNRTKNTLTHWGRVLVDGVATWVRGDPKIRDALEDASRPAAGPISDRLANALIARGRLIMQMIVDGILAGPDPGGAVAAKLRGSTQIPQSPVREGPLKHPFLPNLGKKIVEQINDGVLASELAVPPMGDLTAQLADLGSAPAGAGIVGGGDRTQQIHIDRLYANDARDEQSAAAKLAFLMPEV